MGIHNILILSVTWLVWIISALGSKNQIHGFNKFLTTTAFLIPFYGLSFLIFGFQISFIKFTPLFIMGLYLLQNNYKFSNDIKSYVVYLLGLTLISYLISLLTGNFTNVIENYNRPILNAYIDPLIQSIFFLSSISQIWLIHKNSIFNSISILKSYIYGSYFLIIFGYIQYFLVRMNIVIFKYHFIGYANDISFTNRMNSLAGEPKNYADHYSNINTRKNNPMYRVNFSLTRCINI